MAYGHPAQPPLPEAALSALADVLVSTDEINAGKDAPHGSWGWGSELNTGVLFFRATPGSLAVVQAWRQAMMRVRAAEFVNDQGMREQPHPATHGTATLTQWSYDDDVACDDVAL